MVRFKTRYLLLEVRLDHDPSSRPPALEPATIYHAIKSSVALNFGDEGSARVARTLHVKYFCPTTGLCVVRAGRDDADMVRHSMFFMSSIKRCPASLHTLRVAGSTRTMRRAAVLQHRLLRKSAQGAWQEEEERIEALS